MDRFEGKVAVVTGASSGIGAQIAKELVARGMLVVGLARRLEKLEELADKLKNEPGKFFSQMCDMRNEDDIKTSFSWVKENVGHVHILVNNAGLTKYSFLTDGPSDDWREVFDVNVLALCICSKEAITVMKEHNIRGHIININSITGHSVPNLPIPVLNVYPSSKFAVTAITESLQMELRYLGKKIKVTSISPGLTKTEWLEGLGDTTKNALSNPTVPILNPKDIAEAVIYVLSTGENVQITELTIQALGELY